MLERWTRVVLRYRVPIVAIWLGVLVAGAWAAPRLAPLLADSFTIPGTDSERASAILAQHFDERVEGAFVVVFDVPGSGDPREREAARRRLRLAAREVPSGRPGPLRAGGGVLWGNIETSLDLQHAKAHTDAVRAVLRSEGGVRAYVTGQPAIQRDLDRVFARDLRRGQAIALAVALLTLVAVFGLSLAVAIPFVVAGSTIGGTLLLVWLLAHEVSMVGYVRNLVELIGLALAIDYSLLIVHRFREELGRGLDVADAVARTMATAGRSVVFSGLAVAGGLAILLLLPVPFIRSMGIGGLLVPLVSIAAALTLQPVLLSLLGRRVGARSPGAVGSGAWTRLARTIMRRPRLVAGAGLALLLVLALPARSLELTPGGFDGLPTGPEAIRGLTLLDEQVGAGVVTPTHLIVDSGAADGTRDPRIRDAIDRLAARLTTDPEANVVARGRQPPYVDPTRRYARVVVAARHDWGDAETRLLVERLREQHVPAAAFPERRAPSPEALPHRAPTSSSGSTPGSRGSSPRCSCSPTSCCCGPSARWCSR